MSPIVPANSFPASPPNGRSTTPTRPSGASPCARASKFHDGSDFNADAVIWNLDKVLNEKAPQFDKRQSAQVKTRLPSVASYAKIDDGTVEITTKSVDSFFPYQMLWFLVSSPAQYEKVGKDWDKFASQPSGTGPFKLTKLVPRELAELSKNSGLLGQEAHSESRQARARPDAGSPHPHQRRCSPVRSI